MLFSAPIGLEHRPLTKAEVRKRAAEREQALREVRRSTYGTGSAKLTAGLATLAHNGGDCRKMSPRS